MSGISIEKNQNEKAQSLSLIWKMLDIKERDHERAFTLSCLIIFGLLFIFVTIYLALKDSELFIKTLQYLGAFAGLVFGSHKIKLYFQRKE